MADSVECTDLIGYNRDGEEVFRFDPNFVWLRVGAAAPVGPVPRPRPYGTFTIQDRDGNTGVEMGNSWARIGRPGSDGFLNIVDAAGNLVAQIIGENATLFLGCGNKSGNITLRDGAERQVIRLVGDSAAIFVGAEGNEGDIIVRDAQGREAIKLDGQSAAIYLGNRGNEGDIVVRDAQAREVFKVDGQQAALYVGATGNEGDIIVLDEFGREAFKVDGRLAAMTIGSQAKDGLVVVRDGHGNERIRLDGETGDIRLRGADCAEEFDVLEGEAVDAGTVLVIDDEGALRPCTRAYDRCVAGVVSGANGLVPGIVLDKNPEQNHRLPIALNGKVYCKVDAQSGPIQVGDLLTTSDVPGHAMKALEAGRAFGAVIGKALRSHETGQGLIPILVSLQ